MNELAHGRVQAYDSAPIRSALESFGIPQCSIRNMTELVRWLRAVKHNAVKTFRSRVKTTAPEARIGSRFDKLIHEWNIIKGMDAYCHDRLGICLRFKENGRTYLLPMKGR